MSPISIRALDPLHPPPAEVELVARRMRATLEEVIGEERGGALYTLDWLRERVRFHLDPARSAAVFLAELEGEVAGHTIVRAEAGESTEDEPAGLGPHGLFSTTYVAPAHRRAGVALALLRRGEAWMRAEGLPAAATNTAADNGKLLALYEREGYRVRLRADAMVKLWKEL